jgi:hypothetical protein
MRPAFKDERDELGGARADRRGVGANTLDRPLGLTPVRARRVLGDRRVPGMAVAAQVHRDTLASQKMRPSRTPHYIEGANRLRTARTRVEPGPLHVPARASPGIADRPRGNLMLQLGPA